MNTLLPIDAALYDRNLLGAALGDTSSWATWITTLRAAAGLPLTEEQAATFATISGNRKPPDHRVRELWCVVGRGGGKSRTAAAISVHVALLTQHKLAPGEIGFVLVLSQTVGQARTVFSYARAFIEASPILRREIESLTQTELRLRGNVIIGTHPNSFRSIRGRTILVVIFDESAFWRDETSANPDIEAYRAVLPSVIRSGGVLVGISTPYRKSGLLFSKYKNHFGVDNPDILVVQGNSRVFNPNLDDAAIAQAMDSDPEAGASEWMAEFRGDISSFVTREAVENCVSPGLYERPPLYENTYFAFTDPSGGSSDSFTLAIAHKENDIAVLDLIRERIPPFAPEVVVAEFADVMQTYGIKSVTGDRYAGEWPREQFHKRGIKYDVSDKTKNDIYINFLPVINSRRVELLDNQRLIGQLVSLERRTARGGRDTIDHPPRAHDDIANAAAGVLLLSAARKRQLLVGTVIGNY